MKTKHIMCGECCGNGWVFEQFEPVPGGGMPGDDKMGESVRCKIKCKVCNGKKVIPVPEDYEECGDCGFDHSYEYDEAFVAHQALDKDHSNLATGED